MTTDVPFSPDDISDWFWSIIADAKRDRERLASLLLQLKQQEIVRFHRDFKEAASALTEPPFTDHLEDLSEDGIQDVAEWVVSQGKDYYINVWNHTELMPISIETVDQFTLSGVASNVYWDRFNRSIPI